MQSVYQLFTKTESCLQPDLFRQPSCGKRFEIRRQRGVRWHHLVSHHQFHRSLQRRRRTAAYCPGWNPRNKRAWLLDPTRSVGWTSSRAFRILGREGPSSIRLCFWDHLKWLEFDQSQGMWWSWVEGVVLCAWYQSSELLRRGPWLSCWRKMESTWQLLNPHIWPYRACVMHPCLVILPLTQCRWFPANV